MPVYDILFSVTFFSFPISLSCPLNLPFPVFLYLFVADAVSGYIDQNFPTRFPYRDMGTIWES
ncbi:hypothetical protein CLOAM0237 [Candidatus Cloacimonas acidaminovorans str. Evry]|uniref:Uncharacterized protein n=1 Tax=Cloacimonas acidaminovorans (strain Evry) TaxID=459349 RepID=B0VF92_CLOAI|nr:hypothetical protein CLOAM0237 [Candidatus Cloacimonas acidaminovorans str. Evry]